MKETDSADLSDVFDWTPPEKENAAAAGPCNGAEISAAQKNGLCKHTEFAPENQVCDLPLAVSMFADVKAQRIEPYRLSLRQLQDRLNSTTARDKAALPLVKLATFGDARTDKGSLRHDANLLRVSGVGVAIMGREELLQRAMHTVSDFPDLLTGAGNRVLADAYRRAESPLKQLARQRTAADFRPLSTLKVGNFTKLEKVTEAGEIKALSTAEAKEGYSLETFGGIFTLSRKAVINDDLGASARWGEMMGQAAAETEAGQLLALLTANAGAGVTMGDGKALGGNRPSTSITLNSSKRL